MSALVCLYSQITLNMKHIEERLNHNLMRHIKKTTRCQEEQVKQLQLQTQR